MADQHGRTVLVTGANSRIGFHQALELARRGAHVLLASRNSGRGPAARAATVGELRAASIELACLDLADLDSVGPWPISCWTGPGNWICSSTTPG